MKAGGVGWCRMSPLAREVVLRALREPLCSHIAHGHKTDYFNFYDIMHIQKGELYTYPRAFG